MPSKHFTILHSNDLHGDFLAESQDDKGQVGGLALLSGYINQVRREVPNTLYVVAGDIVQGSLIDTEFKGISTVEIMNYLSPDVVTLGNHELDYGLPHLLFLERMASFPVVNANLYIRKYNKRLMRPYMVKKVDGFDILFIGIITETVLDSLKQDREIAAFISLEDAATEVGKICNAYKDEDVDLTVLLTHIGHESDQKLAALLDPAWGVDMIIGGHSHTVLDKPAVVNGILIAQAGVGTNQIGRFDIEVDDVTNSIVDYRWQLVPVTSASIEPDTALQDYIGSFQEVVDRKYNALLSHLVDPLTHPSRVVETPLGNLFADIVAERAECDVAFLGSGSIRVSELGPVVTLGTLRTAYPYNDSLLKYTISGAQLRSIFSYVMRPENRTGEGECYQVNGAVRATYEESRRALVGLTVGGRPVRPDGRYTICVQGYHAKNSAKNLGLPAEALGASRVVSTSAQDVLEEYLRAHQNLQRQVEGRLMYR